MATTKQLVAKKPLTKEKLKEMLQKRNERFEKLSPAKKRVAIAKDALEQISKKICLPTQGTYVTVYPNSWTMDQSKQLNEAIECNEVECNVCAKGILFLSHVVFTNKIKVCQADAFNNSDPIEARLKGVFERNQLDLIESAFEKNTIAVNDFLGDSEDNTLTDVAKRAIKFGEKYRNTTNRLKAILNNIIENKGEFIP